MGRNLGYLLKLRFWSHVCSKVAICRPLWVQSSLSLVKFSHAGSCFFVSFDIVLVLMEPILSNVTCRILITMIHIKLVVTPEAVKATKQSRGEQREIALTVNNSSGSKRCEWLSVKFWLHHQHDGLQAIRLLPSLVISSQINTLLSEMMGIWVTAFSEIINLLINDVMKIVDSCLINFCH